MRTHKLLSKYLFLFSNSNYISPKAILTIVTQNFCFRLAAIVSNDPAQ